MLTTLATLQFDLADQRAFARWSGDFNPVHLDPIACRRMAPGEPIVHGMHLLLRALDAHFKSARGASRWTVSARFQRPALAGDRIRVERRGAGRLALAIDGGAPLVEIAIEAAAGAPAESAWVAGDAGSRPSPSKKPRERSLTDIAGSQGVLPLTANPVWRRAFPHAARALGADAVAAIASISRLVGMECPGRDALLSSVHLEIRRDAAPPRLAWRVAQTDARFGLVRLDVSGGSIRGTVDAFLRSRAGGPPSFESVATRVDPNEFAGQRALVVGGSRGLGAATALLVAAGGGVPLVTFATGRADAAALGRDAGRGGRRIDGVRFDATADRIEPLARAAARFAPTHLYYFATPPIFARRREPFDEPLFQRFASFYVAGFARACAAAANGSSPLVAFYPSSTAVERPPRELLEYGAAKAAGEAAARALASITPGLRVLVRRLPRVATDQTASIVPAAAVDPVDAMLPIVREMHHTLNP